MKLFSLQKNLRWHQSRLSQRGHDLVSQQCFGHSDSRQGVGLESQVRLLFQKPSLAVRDKMVLLHGKHVKVLSDWEHKWPNLIRLHLESTLQSAYWTHFSRLLPSHIDGTMYTVMTIGLTIPVTPADLLSIVSHINFLQNNCVNVTQVCAVTELMKYHLRSKCCNI